MSATAPISPTAPDRQAPGDGRSPERLRVHFELERQLADRLRRAPAQERLGLYAQVYDELFDKLPDHPQHQAPTQSQQALAAQQWRLLGAFAKPWHRLVEIGPGDCALARLACAHVRQVTALDVSAAITQANQRQALPLNLRIRLFDGVNLPLQAGAADLVYSHQLMEHLHPDDAQHQLRDIARSVAPGGQYVCVTPHRFSGPHDISAAFSDVPVGLHLHEYTGQELVDRCLAAGFAQAQVVVQLRHRVLTLPPAVLRWLENQVERLPTGAARRDKMLRRPFSWLSTLCVVARVA